MAASQPEPLKLGQTIAIHLLSTVYRLLSTFYIPKTLQTTPLSACAHAPHLRSSFVAAIPCAGAQQAHKMNIFRIFGTLDLYNPSHRTAHSEQALERCADQISSTGDLSHVASLFILIAKMRSSSVRPAYNTIAETNNESWEDCWTGSWADTFANRALRVSRSRVSFYT